MFLRVLLLVPLSALLLIAADTAPVASDPYAPWFERARAAGMPDLRGATCWRGTWRVEPDQEDFSSPRRLGFRHLHLRLPDGRWLMRGIYLRPAGEPTVMMKEGFTRILTSDPPAANQDDLLDYDANTIAGAGLFALVRLAGLPQASEDERVFRDPWRHRGWSDPGRLVLSTTPVELMMSYHQEITTVAESAPLPPDHQARRALHLLLVTLAQHAGSVDDVHHLTTAALALLDPSERTTREPLITRLADLPADLDHTTTKPAEIAQDWLQNLYAQQVHEGGEAKEWHAGGGVIPWTVADADALVDLLGDTRPSRWLDHTLPRTVGDNALRTLGWLWGIDPRLLVGRDPQALWTLAEQQATAQAIQEWWRPWRGRTLGDVIVDEPRLHPLLITSQVLTACEPRFRPALARVITANWRTLDQTGRDALPRRQVEDILALIGEDADLRALVRTWPVTGPLRTCLALWHEALGERAPLTAHLRDVLTMGYDDSDVYPIMRVTALEPDQERLDLFLTALRLGTDSKAFRFAHRIRCECQRGYGYGGEARLVERYFSDYSGSAALVTALVLVGLFDERPVDGTHPENANAPGQRVCDDILLHRAPIDLHDMLTDDLAGFAARPLAERDAIIARCRTTLLARTASLLRVAGLRLQDPRGGGALKGEFPAWWQAELDAAKAEHQAIALLFTNTRTCAPCRGLEREVLSQPQWKNWAETHLRMVVLDGAGQDQAYFDRINEVFAFYEGAGIPSFFLVDTDGRRLGRRWSFAPGVGPAWYITEFERVLNHQR